MKILAITICIIFCTAVVAQSPSLSVQFSMDKSDKLTSSSHFKIEMKICQPIKKTEKNDWFTNETSSINFSKPWENILIFKITNTKSRALELPMYVIMPIKYKSFVSSISIADVVYHSGNIEFIDNAVASYPKKRLTINHSLKNETGIAVEKSLYKDWISN